MSVRSSLSLGWSVLIGLSVALDASIFRDSMLKVSSFSVCASVLIESVFLTDSTLVGSSLGGASVLLELPVVGEFSLWDMMKGICVMAKAERIRQKARRASPSRQTWGVGSKRAS